MHRMRFLLMFIVLSALGLESCDARKVEPRSGDVRNFASEQEDDRERSFHSLIAGFADPPKQARPSVYWYWISGDISREGIRKDLEAMAAIGIGEAFIGNVDVNEDSRGSVKVLSDEWWNLVAYAVEQGSRLGVDIGMFNSPGWSQSGGPWVEPQESMRYVAFSETRVSGPAAFHGKLEQTDDEFQDIAVLAFPAPAFDDDSLIVGDLTYSSNEDEIDASPLFDGDPDTVFEFSQETGVADNPLTIHIRAQDSYTARAIEIYAAKDSQSYFDIKLEAKQQDGRFKPVTGFRFDRRVTRPQLGAMHDAPVTESFDAVTSDEFRIVISNRDPHYSGGIADINITGAARLDRYVEKQLGKLWQTPLPLWSAYDWPEPREPDDSALTVHHEAIIDLSGKMSDDGVLTWSAPEGEWIVVRFGMAPTRVMNDPASPEATGLEIDKMNADHLRHHFDAHLGEALRRISPDARQAFTTVVADSYEQGAQNWTEGFRERFESKYGYDPVPWLPVLTGRVVGDAAQSDRFLWDLRRLVADMVSYEYVGGLRDLAHEHGLSLWLENYGHWGFPGEFLQYGGQTDRVGGEFWVHPRELGSIEVRAAASAAHIYGKSRVSAEAFTTSDEEQFTLAPYDLKALGDWAQTEGANHFVLHVYIHQPRDDRPGVNAPFGTEFNRNNTWFGDASSWTDYLSRSHFLLQQGVNAADIVYFIGEDTPKMTGVLQPNAPDGFDFDFINAEVISERLEVVDGAFALPNGAKYRLLVLPPSQTMTPELVAKLKEMTAAGGVIYGPRPERSPSLENYPDADRTVEKIASDMWGDCGDDGVDSVAFGQGKVFCSGDLAAVLAEIGAQPDLAGVDSDKILWKHRSAQAAEIYFLSNQSDEAVVIEPSFSIPARYAEVWDAVSGERYAAEVTNENGNEAAVTLPLAPRESVFVVFPSRAPEERLPSFSASRELEILQTINGPWRADFPKTAGGPGSIMLDELVDWTSHDDPGVQHFSGAATYKTTLNLSDDEASRRLFLDLGRVEDLARVRVNGVDMGAVWTAPWRADISGAVKAGENAIEIDVINTWRNRVIGDMKGVGDAPYLTLTKTRYSQSSPLVSAGLIGPVTVLGLQ